MSLMASGWLEVGYRDVQAGGPAERLDERRRARDRRGDEDCHPNQQDRRNHAVVMITEIVGYRAAQRGRGILP